MKGEYNFSSICVIYNEPPLLQPASLHIFADGRGLPNLKKLRFFSSWHHHRRKTSLESIGLQRCRAKSFHSFGSFVPFSELNSLRSAIPEPSQIGFRFPIRLDAPRLHVFSSLQRARIFICCCFLYLILNINFCPPAHQRRNPTPTTAPFTMS